MLAPGRNEHEEQQHRDQIAAVETGQLPCASISGAAEGGELFDHQRAIEKDEEKMAAIAKTIS